MKLKVIIFFFILFTLLSNCSSEKPIDNDLRLKFQSTHYNYYLNEGDNFILDTIWMEKHYDWVTDILEIDPSSKLNYYKYKNRQHLLERTGKNTNGFSEIGSYNFHSIWHPEGHENVHTLVINEIAHPPALFNEGIAVALAPQPIYGHGIFIDIPTWNGRPIDEIVSELKQNNAIPDISSLLESNDFFNYNTNITYPLAGSFCKYLIENHSINQFRFFLGMLEFCSSIEEINFAFLSVYNSNIQFVWDNWKMGM